MGATLASAPPKALLSAPKDFAGSL